MTSKPKSRNLSQLSPATQIEYKAALRHLIAARDAGQVYPMDFAAANDRLFDAFHATPVNQAWIAAARPAKYRRGVHTA
jgi:hypothetical protein